MISVIVPLYNVERYLDKCITSILSQTYPDIEVILINDGSTDASLSICKRYAETDNRIMIVDQENGGVSAARNAGLELAQGEYVCFIDADDYVDENYLAILYNNIVLYNADISTCSWTKNVIDNSSTSKKISTWDKEGAFYNLLKYKKLCPEVCCKLYSREIIKDIRFKRDIRLGEDKIFFMEAIERSKKVVFQDISAYAYVFRETSAMNTKVDARYWDAVYRAEWIAGEAVKFPELSGLFQYDEINIYLFLMIMNYKSNTTESIEIANFVEPRIKASKTREYIRYATSERALQYVLIKYFSPLAKLLVLVKKKLPASH